MIYLLFIIFFVLVVLAITALAAVGLCLGIAYLMIYFVPDLTLVNALIPAAILTTSLLVLLARIWQLWIKASAVSDYHNDYDDDYEDDKPLPPIIVRPSKKNRR
jgi:membrane protein implicated in regulation of membrane protease activity